MAVAVRSSGKIPKLGNKATISALSRSICAVSVTAFLRRRLAHLEINGLLAANWQMSLGTQKFPSFQKIDA